MTAAVDLPLRLTDYQRRWLLDGSRFKVGCWSRQAGKSFVTSLEAALDAHETGRDWVLLSASEVQSRMLMEQLAVHLRAIQVASQEIHPSQLAAGQFKYRQLMIRLPNGARIIGRPANPRTARGFAANVLLDEFAMHVDGDGIWRALFPCITRGYKIRVVSTPRGRKNRFYQLCNEPDNGFARHTVNVHDAVAGGLVLRGSDGRPCSPQELRTALGDEIGWREEYLVEFVDESTAFLTHEMIAACQDAALSCAFHPAELDARAELYVGVDLARRRDLTVIWVLQRVGEERITRGVITLSSASFREQAERLWDVLRRPQVRRACIDASGLGMQLAEQAVERFGPTRVEPITFTPALKSHLAGQLRMHVEQRTLRIPADAAIVRDFHSVERVVTPAGHVRYQADAGPEGHADRFWAAGLALHAAEQPAGAPEYVPGEPLTFARREIW
jgi:phage FluMu gp28-like protein